jgi:ribosomal-protein-alanine N-acetyltransferase
MLELRPIETGDAPALHAMLSDPGVAVWLRPAGSSGPFSRAECEAMAGRDVAHWAAHGFGPWLVLDGETGVGRGGLHHTVADGRAEVEIGWFVARERWGEGLAALMGERALALAAERGIAGVVAFTRVDNGASQRVMQKLGMTYEKDFVHAGLPHVMYRAVGG